MNSDTDQYILVVEDNPADVRVIERVFDGDGRSFSLNRVSTGTKALEFLFAGFGDHRRPPSLVLLDLNLPGTDGRTILKEMKADEQLRSIPVVVLTTSDNPEDRTLCYEAGANSYVVKPNDPDAYRRQLQSLEEYWFETVSLPGDDS